MIEVEISTSDDGDTTALATDKAIKWVTISNIVAFTHLISADQEEA